MRITIGVALVLGACVLGCNGDTNNGASSASSSSSSSSSGSGGSGGIGGGGGSGGGSGGSGGIGGGVGGGGGSGGGVGGGGGSGGGGGGPQVAPRVVAYFTSWGVYERQYFVKNIETSGSASKITHLNFAFANVQNGEATIGDSYADLEMSYTSEASVDGVGDTFEPGEVRGNFGQLAKLKALHPNIKIMISLGGFSWSGNFPGVAATADTRKKFIDSAIDRFIRGNFAAGFSKAGIFDGIDVDWEYPTKAESASYKALLSEFRAALDLEGQKAGKEYLLTIAAPAGPMKIADLDLPGIVPSLDWINVMAYDYHGAWESTTHFHSALYGGPQDPDLGLGYFIDKTIGLYLGGGVPAGKLVLGVPFYGRGWSGVEPGPMGDGLYQAALGPAPAKYEAGIQDYKLLKGLEGTYQTYTHPTTKAFYIYSPQSKLWWSYDNPGAMTTKMQYIKEKSLSGAMVWELSGDDATGTLVSAVAAGLGN